VSSQDLPAEDGGSKVLLPHHYMASQPRRPALNLHRRENLTCGIKKGAYLMMYVYSTKAGWSGFYPTNTFFCVVCQ